MNQKIKSRKIKTTKVSRNFIVDKEKHNKKFYRELNKKDKLEIEKAVRKTVKEYGETLKLLGKT